MRVSDINYDIGEQSIHICFNYFKRKDNKSKKAFIFQSHSRGYDKQNQSKIEKQKNCQIYFWQFFW